jgi:nucleoside phosphorylase
MGVTMTTLTLAELKGSVDFGIITIRRDEYQALLKRFPGKNNSEGERNYRISDILANEAGKFIRVAIVRCTEPGLGEAQSVAHDLITDLNPRCLLAVGIAGGIPDDDFSLGDVVIATKIHDFSVEAVLQQGREFSLSGGPVPKDLQTLTVSLEAYEQEFVDWFRDRYMPEELPPVEYDNLKKYYGPDEWREQVKDSLQKHFQADLKNHALKFVDGPVASSDRYIRNVEYTQNLLSFLRQTKAVEMEVAGVYRASRKAKGKDYLITTIRGISDVIGFKRDHEWTRYACHSAAAFTYAFVKSGLLIPPQTIDEKGVLIVTSVNTTSSQTKLQRIQQALLTVRKILESTNDLLGGYITVGDCDDAIENIHKIKAELSKIPQILPARDGIPKTLLPFYSAYLVEFGRENDGGLNAIRQNIQNLRGKLRTNEAEEIQPEIYRGINDISQRIRLLVARHLDTIDS